ncbi:ABC transporter permease [Planctomicrobium sp. SH668]|uniref:ABC transporter permease n=1 Tax=Planctomicrobium sp. SH668 TaxID=3448126 RepID=UPI003F5BCE03
MWSIGGIYVLLIVLMLAAIACRTTPEHIITAIQKPEIAAAFWLTMQTCTFSSILAIWIGTPLAYLLSRQRFLGRSMIEAVVDIPLILPPLVIGLCLLSLFHISIGQWQLERWFRNEWNFPVTYSVPSIILAQFVVSTAIVVRTLRMTFDRINPRYVSVARTLGCSRFQAFWRVCLPQAIPGILASFTIAWARSMGEFGPILVFSGTTPFRTQVLSTSIYLELGIGNLECAIAISLMMVLMAVIVLYLLRLLGARTTA